MRIDARNYRQIIEMIKSGICPFCEEEFSSLSGTLTHIQSRHQPSSCPVCKKGNYKNLRKHLSRSSDCYHELAYAIFFNKSRSRIMGRIRKKIFGEVVG